MTGKGIVTFVTGAAFGAYAMYNHIYHKLVHGAIKAEKEKKEKENQEVETEN